MFNGMGSSEKVSPQFSVFYSDIARASGVSVMTVSRVMRNTHHVKASTRQRVLEAAEALGYRPNPLIQTLMAGVRRRKIDQQANIAWVTFHSAKGELRLPFRQMRDAARARAQSLGFGFDLFRPGDLTADQVDRIFQTRGVAGMVIEPLPSSGTEAILPWDRYPLATIGRSLLQPRLHYAMGNSVQKATYVINQLTRRGYRRLCFLARDDTERRTDYIASMAFGRFLNSVPREHQIPIAYCDGWSTSEYTRWLATWKPDVVICNQPFGLVRPHETGCFGPESTGLVTLSWQEDFPDCSGMRNAFDDMGAVAVDMVIAQLHRNECGPPSRPRAVLVEGEWIEGKTLRPLVGKN